MYLKLRHIRLEGFTGMRLNDVQVFDFTITESINVILGRNGSGKSRLLDQLSPLAPSKSDFNTGGKKVLTCESDNTIYILTCKMKGSSLKCTFYNETTDEYLCRDASPSVFNKFVADILRYTKDLHDLVTGKVRLTQMRTPERRKWFGLLSESDLTYALKFYKKAREHSRDISGLIVNLKRSIGDLRPKVLETTHEREALSSRISLLESDLYKVESLLRDEPGNRSMLSGVLPNYLADIERTSNAIIERQAIYPPEVLEYDVAKLNNTLSYNAAAKKALLSKLNDVEERINRYDALITVDTTELRKQVDDLQQFIDTECTTITQFPNLLNCDLSDLQYAKSNAPDYCGKLITIMGTLNTDRPKDNLMVTLDSARTLAGTMKSEYNRLTNLNLSLTADLKHISNTCDITCPSCSTSFKPGITDADVVALQARSEDTSNALVELQKQITAQDELIEEYHTYVVAYGDIANMSRSYAHNSPISLLFKTLNDKGAFRVNPLRHTGLINRFQEEVATATHIANSQATLKLTEYDLKLAEATSAEDITLLQRIKAETEAEIGQHIDEERIVRRQLVIAERRDANELELDKLCSSLDTLVGKMNDTVHTTFVNMRNEELLTHKDELWGMLSVSKQRYKDMCVEAEKLAHYEEELSSAQERALSATQIVKAMSPDEGILAKYLYQCITQVTNMMTEFISRIWGYEMMIEPCKVDDGEMDYKFPMWAKDSAHVSDDISYGSKAQREVCDFVFVLTVYRAMGLECYPLDVDETLAAFDAGHRDMAIMFIKDIIGKQHHSQCFMVSHDATTHFKLTHADVIVLDKDGIEVSGDYNKNVIIR